MAKKAETSQSDIEPLLVSDALTLEDAYRVLEPAEAQLGRHLSPTLCDADELRARRESKHPFLARVLAGPHVVLTGTLDGDRAAR